MQEINYHSLTALPTVAPYWREQGKSKLQINDENVALPVAEITTSTPALQDITNTVPLQDDTQESKLAADILEISDLLRFDSEPSIKTTRDYQPLTLKEFAKPTTHARLV